MESTGSPASTTSFLFQKVVGRVFFFTVAHGLYLAYASQPSRDLTGGLVSVPFSSHCNSVVCRYFFTCSL